MSKATLIEEVPDSLRLHGTLSGDGRFWWSVGWQQWVPTGQNDPLYGTSLQPPLLPLESGPLLPERHSESCECARCWQAGVRYADYLKERKANDL